jgi:quercetin dioxygenase-like cupin family protein
VAREARQALNVRRCAHRAGFLLGGVRSWMTSHMARRGVDDTMPVRTVFLRRGTSSAIHRHGEAAAWIHVVSGVIVEERWTRDAEGGFVHEVRRLEKGQSMAAPADALHRVTALEDDAAFVSTCTCHCGRARSAPAPEIEAVTKLSRRGEDRAWAASTVIGEPCPELDGSTA